MQVEWDTFPWATRPKEALCVTQLHVIPVVARLLLLPLKYCPHYPTPDQEVSEPQTTRSHKNTLKKYHCNICYSLPTTYYWLWSEPSRGSLIPFIPAVSVVLQPRAVLQQGQGAQPVWPLSKAAAFSVPPATSTCFPENPFNYRFLA